MASSLYENIEDWELERLSGEFEDHYSDKVDPKEHSFEVTNENGEDFGNRNHCNGTNGIHQEANDREVNEETNDSNDEHDANEEGNEGEEGNISAPYYGRTLVAPEYMSFQIQDPAAAPHKEDNGVGVIGEEDCTVAGGTDDFGKGHGEEEETSHSFDRFTLAEGEGDSCEDGHGECGTSEEVNLRNEDHVDDSPRPSRLDGDDGKGNKDDFKGIADLEGKNEQERDENELHCKEETLSENDEVDNVHEDEGDEQDGDEDGEQGGDEKENDEDNKGSTDLAPEKEVETDENEVYLEERPSKDGSSVEEFCEDKEEDGEPEINDAKTEETVETKEQSEDDSVKRNIEDNEVDEKHDTDENKDHKEEETNNEDEESSQEEDESDKESEDDRFHHEYKITEDKDGEEDNEDKSVSAKDMAINRLTKLEHCDSLRVNVASPTRDITNVSSTESLNETDAGHAGGDDPDEQAEKLTEEPEKEQEPTINEPLEVNDEQQYDDDGEEIASDEDSGNSDDSVENVNEPGQDVRKEENNRDDNEEDLKPDLEEGVAKNEGKAEEEEAFPVHRKPQGREDEADLTGKVKELGRIFEGGGPFHPKGVKKDLDAADGSPVSVRKFKAIFETHQYSAAERNQEPGRKEESSSPPRGIVKNLRGLFENPQSFETRNG